MTATLAPQTDPDAIAERARRFVDEQLIPREQAAERAAGRLPAQEVAAIRAAGLEAGLAGGLHAVEHGGQGWSHGAWALVEEQFGRSTNALSWHVPNAYNVWSAGSEAQIERWLRPMLRGEAQDAYAVTEALAGSDPSGIETTAEPLPAAAAGASAARSGSSPAATSPTVIIVVAVAPEGPTLFLVPAGGGRRRRWSRIPTTRTPIRTATRRCASTCEVGPDAVLGPLGGADELQRAWFTEERLGIAARGIGAMQRLLEETLAWATGREQGGARLWDHQGVAFPLADSAADAAAGRLLVLEVARLADAGADPKLVHAKASMAKLFVSEAACRCADRAVQAFGGRGYRRDNVAERFLRELRVDRIWEGTSEIQRLIIARSLERRGVEQVLR